MSDATWQDTTKLVVRLSKGPYEFGRLEEVGVTENHRLVLRTCVTGSNERAVKQMSQEVNSCVCYQKAWSR